MKTTFVLLWAAIKRQFKLHVSRILAGLCGVALLFAPTLAKARTAIPAARAHVSVQTLGATSVTSSSALLIGNLAVTYFGSGSGEFSSTTFYFEYGPTTNYGRTTPAFYHSGWVGWSERYTILVTSLAPGTTYHFRAVVDGVYYSPGGYPTPGADLTFTTPPLPTSLVVSNINDSGAGSLRNAIAGVQAGGLITFAPNLSGQTVLLTSGQLVLNTNVTIDASALANGIAINGNASSRIFQVKNGANVVLNALTLTNGYLGGSGAGGAIINAGTLTLNNCTLGGNSVAGAGGAIHNDGQLTLNGCALFANTGAFAGALNNNAVCTLKNCTFFGNSATKGNGGAIDNAWGATLNIIHCTFSGNNTVGEGYGGAIDNYLSQINITNTIIAGNPVYEDIYNWSGSTVNFGGSNIVQVLGNGGTVLGGNTIRAVNPLLGPLANNGGPTRTLLPQSGSSAIDAGENIGAAGLTTDQRGRLRLNNALVDIGAVEVQSPNLATLPGSSVTTNAATLNGTVNPLGITTTAYFQYGLTTSYGSFSSPINPGTGNSPVPYSASIAGLAPGTTYHFRAVASAADGLTYGNDFSFTTPSNFSVTNVVLNTNDAGAGSLRTAIISTAPGGFVIFAPSLSGQAIRLTSGQLVLSTNLTIDASALVNGIAINGNASNRIFQVNGGANVVLNALTLTNGYQRNVDDLVGGAIVNYGTLALTNCTLAGNSVAGSGAGGAIQNDGQLTLNGCALFANTGSFAGALNNNAVCTLKNCTFFGNSATDGNGGAIDNAWGATLNILHCTFTGNSTIGGGGAIDNYLSQLYITNTILAGNTGYGNDIYNWSDSTINFGGSNIVQALLSDGTVTGSSSIRAVNPLLGPLANNGGLTMSQLLQSGSPAINAGMNSSASGLATDQRGQPRLSGGAVDIGATEMQPGETLYSPVPTIVSTTADSGPNSLRDAVANTAYGGIITFAPNLSGQTILLTSGKIVLNKNVTIDASALANGISIDGNASSRIFEAIGGNLVLKSLTITNGFNQGGVGDQSYGGGILSLAHLTLDNCKLVNNRCIDGTAGALAAMFGSLNMNATTVSGNICDNTSAIYIQDQPANIVGCTISGNSGTVGDALRFAAAYNDSALSIVNSTFSGNLVTGNSGFGAAAFTLQALSPFTATAGLTNCTVISNRVVQAGMAGAIYLDPRSGTNNITLHNSIVSGNTSGGVAADISANVTPHSSFNLIGVGGGLVHGVNGNQVGINNPLVAALGNYGGGTQTMPPLPGSPTINAGGTVPFVTDQRGSPRLSGSAVDIGAVELDVTAPAPVISSVTRTGANLIFKVKNGVLGGGWEWLTTTNLALPVIWSTNRTGTFDGQGNVTLTNGILFTEPARYFIIRAR